MQAVMEPSRPRRRWSSNLQQEAMMSIRGLIPLISAAMLIAAGTACYAQNGVGADQQEKGSTGWSGGSKDQNSQGQAATTGQQVQTHDEAEAKNQAPLATGEDLKGPAVQLAPSKTPE